MRASFPASPPASTLAATLALALAVGGCTGGPHRGDGGPGSALERAWAFDLPAPDRADLRGARQLSLWATYYYVPRVRSRPDGHPLRTMQGLELGPRLSARDWCDAALEGTVTVLDAGADGRPVTYNYAGTTRSVEVDCRPFAARYPAISRSRFRLARGPYGDGVHDLALVPYRTIAVDPSRIPYGSVLWVPAARGATVELPDGRRRTHDGWFFAADTGGAIKGTHVDVFLGPTATNPFSFVRSRAAEPFEAWIVEGGGERDARARLAPAHHPPDS